MAVHRKHESIKEEKPTEAKTAASAKGSGEPTEPVVVSDVITETIEVVEKIPPQTSESGARSASQNDPLGDFKSKMVEEAMFPMDVPQKKNYMWPILLIFIIAIVLLVGIFAYKQGMFKGTKVNEVIVTPTPVVTVEPAKAVDLTKYEIEILNGSGVTGEASSQKASLESAGFIISSIGNASNSDYTDTVIKAKAEVDKAFISKLKSALESSFTVGETEALADTSSVPVVVILGTKK